VNSDPYSMFQPAWTHCPACIVITTLASCSFLNTEVGTAWLVPHWQSHAGSGKYLLEHQGLSRDILYMCDVITRTQKHHPATQYHMSCTSRMFTTRGLAPQTRCWTLQPSVNCLCNPIQHNMVWQEGGWLPPPPKWNPETPHYSWALQDIAHIHKYI